MVKNKKSCKCKDAKEDSCKCNKLTTCNYLCNNTCCNNYYSKQEPVYTQTKPKKEKKKKYGKYGKTNKIGKVRIEREGNKVVITDTNKGPRIHVEDTQAYRTQNALLNSLASIPLLTNAITNQPNYSTEGTLNRKPLLQIQPEKIVIKPEQDDTTKDNELYGKFYERLNREGNEEFYERLQGKIPKDDDISVLDEIIAQQPTPEKPEKPEKTELKYYRIAKKAYNKQDKTTVERVEEIYKNRFEGKGMVEIKEDFLKKYGEDFHFHKGITTVEGLVGAILKFEEDRVQKQRGGGAQGGGAIFSPPIEPPPLTDQIQEQPEPDPMTALFGEEDD